MGSKKIRKVLTAAMIFSLILLAGSSSLVPFAPPLAQYASGATNANFGSTINLSSSVPFNSPKVAISGTSNVYVIWQSLSSSQYEIYFKRSTDGGATFSSSVTNISNNAGNSISPQLAASGSNVYVVWQDNTSGNNDIYMKRSTDGGATFSSSVNLSSTPTSSTSPQIAVSGSNVYVVWTEAVSSSNNDIYFKRSADAGVTFGSNVNLSSNSGSSKLPQLAVSGSNVYVVWQDNTSGNNDIYMKRSTDGGATLSAVTNISKNTTDSISPQIAVSGSNVYVVWEDHPYNTLGETFFSRSTDAGSTFSTPVNLDNYAYESKEQRIAVSGSYVHIIWLEDQSSTHPSQVAYVRSTDNGAKFSPLTWLTSNTMSSNNARIVAPAGTGNVFLAYTLKISSNEIAFKSSVDNGATFDSAVNLSNTAGDSNYVYLIGSGNNVYVSWGELTSGSTGVLLRKGATTSTTDTTPPTVSLTAPSNGATISGAVAVTASASDNKGIAKVVFYVDGVIKNTDSASPYSFSLDTLLYLNGGHTIKAVAYDTSNNQAATQVSVTVSNTILDTAPPTVAITSPLSGATVSGTITISASASDNKAVSKVELYVDNIIKATDTTSSYSFSLDTKTLSNSAHTLKAMAYDSSNNKASSQISITVKNGIDSTPPVVTVPSNIVVEATGPTGAVVSFTATAKDNLDGSITPTCLPKSGSVFPLGTTTVKCTAKDSSGNIGSSSFTISVRDTTPPTVAITSPSTGSNLKGVVNVYASASDKTGVTKVQFYLDGVLYATVLKSPYTFSFDKNGNHSIYAIAYDAYGHSAKSSVVSIKVNG